MTYITHIKITYVNIWHHIYNRKNNSNERNKFNKLNKRQRNSGTNPKIEQSQSLYKPRRVADTLPNLSVSETSAERTKFIYIHVYIEIFCTLRGNFTNWQIQQSVGNPPRIRKEIQKIEQTPKKFWHKPGIWKKKSKTQTNTKKILVRTRNSEKNQKPKQTLTNSEQTGSRTEPKFVQSQNSGKNRKPKQTLKKFCGTNPEVWNKF